MMGIGIGRWAWGWSSVDYCSLVIMEVSAEHFFCVLLV